MALLASACASCPNPLAPSIQGSIGKPHRGVLTEGTELPKKGTGFVRYRPHGKAYWGNPRLVEGLKKATRRLQERMPGPPLVVGDLSGRHGGRIPRHRSHRTGRDVDLLWFITTPSGVPLRNPGFIHMQSDGLARTKSGNYVLLDVARQWLLLKALLTLPDIHVQFLFMSRAIEARLVNYALARGEDPELVWHAQTVMLQPGDSTAHSDHIHLRIACTPDEAVAGCQGGGPYWSWLPPLPGPLELSPDDIEAITLGDPFKPPIPMRSASWQTPAAPLRALRRPGWPGVSGSPR